MARQRELLSLTDIAAETGISYPTLRNYVIKYGDEIPSEGVGRSTRYPRTAVKVFQRLRKESKPGRKPANPVAPAPAEEGDAAPAATPPATVIPAALLRRREPAEPAAEPATSPAAAFDTSGIERELAGIREQLTRLADAWVASLERGAALPLPVSPAAAANAAPTAAEAASPVQTAESPAASPEASNTAPEAESAPESRISPERREAARDMEASRFSSQPYRDRQRNRLAWPKTPGRKGPRPE
jgi:hypothetical protein